jgi:two-component system, cell cycle response regulator
VPVQNTNEPKPTVLLIDDSPDVHRLLRARLRHEHLELVDAESGREGVAAARASKPAMVLLDLDMPEMDGFEVLRALKAQQETATIPIVVMSDATTPEDKVTAFDLGATDCVPKSLAHPGDVAELRARIRAVLRTDRLLRLLAERAEIDGLTGLGNRAQFNRRLAQALAENQRYGHPLALALLDADHFKRINDTFGHPAGDEVLTGIARLLQRSLRASDIPCRFGGEEFAVIMPSTTPHDAAAVCDRVRVALQAVTWEKHPETPVTISVGVAGIEGAAAMTMEQLIEATDRALYEAKRSGRNTVQIAKRPIAAIKG